jgi:uncharacterized membrane protein YeaQ/YmgE (transglycosylase-associated protein family)
MDWQAIAVYAIQWIAWLIVYIVILFLLGFIPRKHDYWGLTGAFIVPLVAAAIGWWRYHNLVYVTIGLSAYVIVAAIVFLNTASDSWGHGAY